MYTKKCSKCLKNKDIGEFSLDKAKKDGRYSSCKPCKNLSNKDYLDRNRDKELIRGREKYADNRDEYIARSKRYNGNNKDKRRAWRAKYRATKLNATLPGFDDEILEIYRDRPEGYHVDHIIPLQGDNVCGLHVPWNLQYLPASENLKKSNKISLSSYPEA